MATEILSVGRVRIGRQIVAVYPCGHAEATLAWTFSMVHYGAWHRAIVEGGCGECRGLSTVPAKVWIDEWKN